jgi:hypothetical protein
MLDICMGSVIIYTLAEESGGAAISHSWRCPSPGHHERGGNARTAYIGATAPSCCPAVCPSAGALAGWRVHDIGLGATLRRVSLSADPRRHRQSSQARLGRTPAGTIHGRSEMPLGTVPACPGAVCSFTIAAKAGNARPDRNQVERRFRERGSPPATTRQRHTRRPPPCRPT